MLGSLACSKDGDINSLDFLQNGLAEPIQFCDIMSTARLEELIDPRKRQQSYAAIDLAELVLVLDKYR